MGQAALCLFIAVFEALLNPAMSLTCLQCSNIPRPVHCRTVVDCYEGEMCGIEKLKNSFGENVYNVGCMSRSKCTQSNGTRDCTECCSSNLCNAQGCGEQGYPKARGSICYNCQLYTDSAHCHDIEFCEEGELCMFDARREFGETVYTSGCANIHSCEQEHLEIVGRDLDRRYSVNSRSVKEHVCHHCCKQDMCNRNCFRGIDTTGAHDCKDILRLSPNARSGTYTITLWKTQRQIKVRCDMDTDGGGWTVFQRRVNGSVDFNRNFSEYENGFGTLNGEFWLGLEKIQELTRRGESELRLDIVAGSGSQAYEVFQNFSLGMAPIINSIWIEAQAQQETHTVFHLPKGTTFPHTTGMTFTAVQRGVTVDGGSTLAPMQISMQNTLHQEATLAMLDFNILISQAGTLYGNRA